MDEYAESAARAAADADAAAAAERARIEYEKYKAYVAGVVAANDASETIHNKNTAHASVIIAALFGRAVSEVRILSGSLANDAYGAQDVIDSAVAFLSREGSSMTVVVERKLIIADNKFLTALSAAKLLGKPQFFNAGKNLPFHMALSDNSHYRFEEETHKCEAIAQFGLSDLGALNAAFKKAVAEAAPFVPT